MDTISRDSADEAYEYLKAAILNLEIKPRQPVRTQTLADAVGLSRMPVRQALARLEHERFVERTGGWGYKVRAITFKEALDLYKVREALEVEAVKELIPRADKATVLALRKYLDKAEEQIAEGRLAKFRDNTRLFYRAIAEATSNETLVSMLGVLDDRIRLLGAMMAHRHLGRPKESLAENRAVLAGIERKDAKAAEAAVRAHVSNARETLARYVMTEGHGLGDLKLELAV
jgi:DNA-binding GntR family transcriptional regulator